jgi:tetratricopeptide (TPR) repeat protein
MTPDMLDNPKVAYDGPALKTGGQYELQIKTESGNKVGFTTFDVLDEATITRLKKEISAIQQKKNLSEEAKTLEVSALEQNSNLYSSAIERIERFILKGSASSLSYRFLGDSYLQIDLPERAKERYRVALDLMKKTSNLKAEGEISINLGIIEEELGNIPQAIVWMDKAQQLFSKLNDREKVQSLRDRISELKSRK